MESKPKIVLKTSADYQFRHLLRQFQHATHQQPAFLKAQHLLNVLLSMGFLPQHLTQHHYELVNTIAYLLSHNHAQGDISQRNLFRFMMVITSTKGKIDSHFSPTLQPLTKDLQISTITPLIPIELGQFDQIDRWEPNPQEQNYLHQLFKGMIFTRASRSLHGHDQEQQEQNHSPNILSSSKIMAQQRFRRNSCNIRVEDRLIQGRRLFESRIQCQSSLHQQKQIKQCTFKPKVNSIRFHLEQQSIESTYNRSQVLLMKGRQYDMKLQMRQLEKEEQQEQINQKYCSFTPDLSSSTTSLQNSVKRERVVTIKDGEKVINRLKKGRDQRAFTHEFQKRGYPAGVSWTAFLSQSRCERQND